MEPKVSAVISCSPKDRILIMEIGDSCEKLTRRAGAGMSLSLRVPEVTWAPLVLYKAPKPILPFVLVADLEQSL